MVKKNKKVEKKNNNIPHMTIGIAAVVIAVLLTLTVTDRMPSSRNGDIPPINLVEPDDAVEETETEEEPISEVDNKEPETTDDTTSGGTSGTGGGDTSDGTADPGTEEPASEPVEAPVEDAESNCESSDTEDGIDGEVFGICTGSDGKEYADVCLDDDTLTEYWPAEGVCDWPCTGALIPCENGCSEGACLPEPNCESTDTDSGANSEVFGICTGSDGKEYADVCLDDDTLTEHWPAEGVCDWPCTGALIPCEFGCSEGACLPDPNEQCRDFCTGIAQKEPYVDGLCIDRHGNTASITCNAEGYSYENPISRKCTDTADACCCVGELTII